MRPEQYWLYFQGYEEVFMIKMEPKTTNAAIAQIMRWANSPEFTLTKDQGKDLIRRIKHVEKTYFKGS